MAKDGFKFSEDILSSTMDNELRNRIRDILTLRYHPSGQTTLPKLGWENFVEYPGIVGSVQPLLEGTIRRIVESHNSKQVGIGLSGGVDSTTVLSLTRKCFPNLEIKTFCVTFGEDVKEAEDAKHASELYSTDHKEINIENPFEELETQLRIVDEPRWNIYPYYLFREVAKSCDLLLTGDGGDELFGGYTFRYDYVLKNPQPPVQRYLEAHNRDWVPDQQELFAFPFDWNFIYALLEPSFDNPLPLLGKIFLADYSGKLLYDFAPINGAFANYFKVKTYAPMLEPEIIYTATHLPNSLKYDDRNNLGKLVLRQILLENFGYRPATKAKIGWGMNIVEMWDRYIKDMCRNLFDKPRFVELGLIRKEWLAQGFKKADEHDPRYVNKMFGLLALEIWLKLKKL